MKTRERIQELIEAPKQALVLGLIALGVAVLALLVALGSLAGKAAS